MEGQRKLNQSYHEEKEQSRLGYPSSVTRPKPRESAGYELAESRDGVTQNQGNRSTTQAENQGVKPENQRARITGLSNSMEDRQEKEIPPKSPRIGEIEGTFISKLLESTPISNFKIQEFKSRHPHGNNPEKEFMGLRGGDDYLLCEDPTPLNPERRRDPQQSKGPNGLQIPPKSSERTGNKSPNQSREGYAISDPIMLSSLDLERDRQPTRESLEATTKSGPNSSYRRRSEIHSGSSQAPFMEGTKTGEARLQCLPKGDVWTETQKEMRDDPPEYMMEDIPGDSRDWVGQLSTKYFSKAEEIHPGIKKGS
ncbi:hypothetical protein U1Q18_000575 [Sarracenia purpurea var. burkii]